MEKPRRSRPNQGPARGSPAKPAPKRSSVCLCLSTSMQRLGRARVRLTGFGARAGAQCARVRADRAQAQQLAPGMPGVDAAQVKEMKLGAMVVFDGLGGDAMFAKRIKVGVAALGPFSLRWFWAG
jgi:hypothetical protein